MAGVVFLGSRVRRVVSVVMVAAMVLAWAGSGWAGQVVCPVVADNSIASYPSEQGENYGRSKRLKLNGRSWGAPGEVILEVIHGNGGNVNGWLLARKVADRYELDIPPRAIEAMRTDRPGGLRCVLRLGRGAPARCRLGLASPELCSCSCSPGGPGAGLV